MTRIVKATVSRCTLEDSSSFQSRSNLVSLTRDIPRKAVKIRNSDYRSFLPFRAMMNFIIHDMSKFREDVPENSMMVLVLEDEFEFILATTVNHFVNDSTN